MAKVKQTTGPGGGNQPNLHQKQKAKKAKPFQQPWQPQQVNQPTQPQLTKKQRKQAAQVEAQQAAQAQVQQVVQAHLQEAAQAQHVAEAQQSAHPQKPSKKDRKSAQSLRNATLTTANPQHAGTREEDDAPSASSSEDEDGMYIDNHAKPTKGKQHDIARATSAFSRLSVDQEDPVPSSDDDHDDMDLDQPHFTNLPPKVKRAIANTGVPRRSASYQALPQRLTQMHAGRQDAVDTFAGPIVADERLRMAIGHLIVDGSGHIFYRNHVQAVVAACGSMAKSGEQLQRVVELIHTQSQELGMAENAGNVERHLRESWCIAQAKELSAEVDDREALAAVVAAFIRGKMDQGEKSLDVKAFLRAVEGHLAVTSSAKTADFAAPSSSRQTRAANADTQARHQHPTSASTPSLEDVLNRASKALDAYWDRPNLQDIPIDILRNILTHCFPAPEDLHAVHLMAGDEVNSHWTTAAFDLAASYASAAKAWSQLDVSERFMWHNRYDNLLNGDLKMLQDMSGDRLRQAAESHYQQHRSPLGRVNHPSGPPEPSYASSSPPNVPPPITSSHGALGALDQTPLPAVKAEMPSPDTIPAGVVSRHPSGLILHPQNADNVVVKEEEEVGSGDDEPYSPPATAPASHTRHSQMAVDVPQQLNPGLVAWDEALSACEVVGQCKKRGKPLKDSCKAAFLTYGFERIAWVHGKLLVHFTSHEGAKQASMCTFKINGKMHPVKLVDPNNPKQQIPTPILGPFVATTIPVDRQNVRAALAGVTKVPFILEHSHDSRIWVVDFEKAVRTTKFTIKVTRTGLPHIIKFQASKRVPCLRCGQTHPSLVTCASLTTVHEPENEVSVTAAPLTT